MSWNKSDGAPDQMSNVLFGSIAGSTYVWQPWFAQVSGSLGILNGANWYSGNTSEFSSVNTRDTNLTGGAALSLFPASRFPFAASFEVTDSRVSGTPVAEGYTSTRISLRQDYAPLRGNWSVSGGYDRGIIDSVSSGPYTVDVFRASTSGGWAAQQAQLNAQYTRNQTATGGESTFANQEARAAVARGQALFNTKPINIFGVSGINDEAAFGNPSNVVGTCSTCHDTPNAGNHSVVAPLNIGIADASRRTPDMPLYTFQHKTTLETITVTDPGRALISGQFKHIGRFKGPILRGLAARAPYFHNGSAKDLNAVLDFFEERFKVDFTEQDRADLVAFLRTL